MFWDTRVQSQAESYQRLKKFFRQSCYKEIYCAKNYFILDDIFRKGKSAFSVFTFILPLKIFEKKKIFL